MSAAARRSGSFSASQASLAATAPASSGIPVRARLMSSPPMRSASARAAAAARWSDHRMPLPIGSPCAVTGTKVCRAPEQATTSTSANACGAWARASAQAMTSVVHQRNGSCSDQPTSGCVVASSERASAARPPSPHSPTLVTVVPKSMVRITGRAPARRRGRPSPRGPGPGTGCGPWPCRRRRPP